MAKNHRVQYIFQHQAQTPSMSTPYTYTVDEDGGTNSSPTPAQMPLPLEEDLEDDHICPVCEGECTCRLAPLQASPSGYTTPPAVAVRTTEPVPSGSKHPSLKIKLTLPSSLVTGRSSASTSNSDAKTSMSSKKRSKSRAETTSGVVSGGGRELIKPPFSAPGQPLMHMNADGSLPKKRGRPSKAVAAARKAAQSQALSAESISNVGGSNKRNVDATRQGPAHTTAFTRRAVTQVKKAKKLSGAAAASRAATQAKRIANVSITPPKPNITRKRSSRAALHLSESSSELSDIDPEDDEDPHAIRYPTFIPAISSSSSGSSSASDLSSDSSDSSSDSEKDDEKTQEKTRSPREKLRMELGLATGDGDDSNHRRWIHRNNWEIRPRRNSVGVEDTSDVGNDSDEETEDEEEEEEDGEADGETEANDEDEIAPGVRRRLMRYAGVSTGWTDDDEESSFDADLFFANLSSSSSISGSDDEDDQMGDAEVGFGDDEIDGQDEDEMDFGTWERQLGLGPESDALTLGEIAAAGFLSPFADLGRDQSLPLSHGWDSMLENSFKEMVDLTLSSATDPTPTFDVSSIPGLAEADIMMATSEEEEAVAMFDIDEDPFSPQQDADREEEDGVEIFEDSDDGETTEDEFVDVDGVQTPRSRVLLRFPASLGGIDPMSTVRSPASRGRLFTAANGQSSPSLAGKKSVSNCKSAVGIKASSSSPDDKENEKMYSSRVPPLGPVMGSFAKELSDKTKKVVIARPGNTLSGEVPPSPFPAIRRIRRGSSIRSCSERGSNHSRTSSFLATRSPYQALVSGDFDSGDTEDLPPAEPIRLDDVLDSAFLEPEPPSSSHVHDSAISEACGNESETDLNKHLESLRRWDRIPIDTFRKTRSAGTANELVNEKPVGSPVRHAPRPADGFSYGSAAGGMLRGSPLSAPLWDSDNIAAMKNTPKQQKPTRRPGRMSVIISPVILPVRDTDRTPTNEHHQILQQQTFLGYTGAHKISHGFNQAQNAKSRKELRKEKKRKRKFFSSPAQNFRRNHFPNSKSRSSGSMQRTNFGSSSVPPLSI